MNQFEGAEYLAHYTKLETALEFILPSKEVLFSPLSKMNDLSETKRAISGWSSSSDALEPDIWEANAVISDRSRVFCTSEGNEFAPCWSNASLWCHYAEGYRGVCIVLNKQKLIDMFSQAFSGKVHFSQLIKYGFFNSIPGLANYRNHAEQEQIIRDYLLLHSEQVFFSKSPSWSGESEYRFFTLASDVNEQTKLDVSECIEAVVIGPQRSPTIYTGILKKFVGEDKVLNSIQQPGGTSMRLLEPGKPYMV